MSELVEFTDYLLSATSPRAIVAGSRQAWRAKVVGEDPDTGAQVTMAYKDFDYLDSKKAKSEAAKLLRIVKERRASRHASRDSRSRDPGFRAKSHAWFTRRPTSPIDAWAKEIAEVYRTSGGSSAQLLFEMIVNSNRLKHFEVVVLKDKVRALLSASAFEKPKKKHRVGRTAIVAVSKDRYRATAAERRLYGGSTVTEFYVYRREDEKDPSKWKVVRGYGKTPGERKTNAIRNSGLA